MKLIPFASLFFLALTTAGSASAYEIGDSRTHYIEWSELGSAPSDWKSDDFDDLYALTLHGAEVTYAFEYRANVSVLAQDGLSAAIRTCHNKDCTLMQVPAANISSGLIKDSVQAFDLAQGINEYSYTIFLWNDGQLLDSDTLVYYISRY